MVGIYSKIPISLGQRDITFIVIMFPTAFFPYFPLQTNGSEVYNDISNPFPPGQSAAEGAQIALLRASHNGCLKNAQAKEMLRCQDYPCGATACLPTAGNTNGDNLITPSSRLEDSSSKTHVDHKCQIDTMEGLDDMHVKLPVSVVSGKVCTHSLVATSPSCQSESSWNPTKYRASRTCGVSPLGHGLALDHNMCSAQNTAISTAAAHAEHCSSTSNSCSPAISDPECVLDSEPINTRSHGGGVDSYKSSAHALSCKSACDDQSELSGVDLDESVSSGDEEPIPLLERVRASNKTVSVETDHKDSKRSQVTRRSVQAKETIPRQVSSQASNCSLKHKILNTCGGDSSVSYSLSSGHQQLQANHIKSKVGAASLKDGGSYKARRPVNKQSRPPVWREGVGPFYVQTLLDHCKKVTEPRHVLPFNQTSLVVSLNKPVSDYTANTIKEALCHDLPSHQPSASNQAKTFAEIGSSVDNPIVLD